jgi:hypothetical protein
VPSRVKQRRFALVLVQPVTFKRPQPLTLSPAGLSGPQALVTGVPSRVKQREEWSLLAQAASHLQTPATPGHSVSVQGLSGLWQALHECVVQSQAAQDLPALAGSCRPEAFTFSSDTPAPAGALRFLW